MKVLLALIVIFFYNDAYSLCEFKNVTSSDEVKYTSQKSINVNDISGHTIRVFKTETNHQNPKKNCEGLKILKTDFFGFSDYIKKKWKSNWLFDCYI